MTAGLASLSHRDPPVADAAAPGPVTAAALIGVLAATCVLVGSDGSPGGRVARVAAAVAATVATWLVLRRAPAAVGALVLVVVALLAVPAGLGVALPHLSKNGLGLPGAAGAVVAGCGLVLLAAGLGRLRRYRGTRTGAAAAVAAVVCLGVTSWTLGQAVAATNVPATPVCTTPPEGVVAPRDVSFRTADGATVSAWYLPGRNGAAVVLRHGAGSTRCSVRAHAAVLARHGYGVLMTDARGHGASGGRAMDFGWYGETDIAAAVAYLRRQPGVDPGRVGAVGLSMGGEEAIGALGTATGPAAVVAEGVTGRVAGDKAWLPGVYGWRGTATERLAGLTYGAADLLTDAAPPATLRRAVRAAAPRPVLVISAGERPDEAYVARSLHAAAPGTVQTWDVPGAAHTGALRARPQDWERRVTAFLDAALLG